MVQKVFSIDIASYVRHFQATRKAVAQFKNLKAKCNSGMLIHATVDWAEFLVKI